MIKAGPLPAFLKWESTLPIAGKIYKEAEQNLPVSFLAAKKMFPCILLLVAFDFKFLLCHQVLVQKSV